MLAALAGDAVPASTAGYLGHLQAVRDIEEDATRKREIEEQLKVLQSILSAKPFGLRAFDPPSVATWLKVDRSKRPAFAGAAGSPYQSAQTALEDGIIAMSRRDWSTAKRYLTKALGQFGEALSSPEPATCSVHRDPGMFAHTGYAPYFYFAVTSALLETVTAGTP
jgi:hypothetical protein